MRPQPSSDQPQASSTRRCILHGQGEAQRDRTPHRPPGWSHLRRLAGGRGHSADAVPSDASAGDSLDAWVTELATALGVDPAAVDRELVLGVSRAAHGVARAGGPITVFLVGLAAGLRGGGVQAVSGAAETARSLATTRTHPASSPEGGPHGF